MILRKNIHTSKGLVNGAVGTVISVKAHHIAVQFDNIPEAYRHRVQYQCSLVGDAA